MGNGFRFVGWLVAGLAASCGGIAAHAAPASRATKAEAVIIRPFRIVKTEDLLFGNMAVGAIQGRIVVSAENGAATHTNVTGLGGTISPARVIGAGTPLSIVEVRWPTDPFTLTRVGGGATMTVSQMRINNCVIFCSQTRGRDPRLVPLDGFLDLRFGGQLNVGANQPDGEYVGTFSVTIDYP